MEIGIIGFGQMGQFISSHLKDHFKITVTDIFDKTKEALKLGVKFDKIKNVASKDIVVIAVPILEFENTIKNIKDHIKEGALIVDVSSVKVNPVNIMKKLLPRSTQIIGTHPLFGPQSGKDGIKGLKIIVCPVRIKSMGFFTSFIEDKLGVDVLLMDPKEHDSLMAKTQLIDQLIARLLIDLDIKKEKISLPSFDKLLELKEMLKDDSLEMFDGITKNNPFAKDITDNFFLAVDNLKGVINNGIN